MRGSASPTAAAATGRHTSWRHPLRKDEEALLGRCLAAGYAVIEAACRRAGVDGERFIAQAEHHYHWSRREQLLNDRACELFDMEARRRGLDPVEASERLGLAREIEESALVKRAFALSDRCHRQKILSGTDWYPQRARVSAALQSALAELTELC